VTKRVSPIDRVRAQIDELFAVSERAFGRDPRARGSAVGAPVGCRPWWRPRWRGFLARARYKHRDEDSPAGYSNGYQPPGTHQGILDAITTREGETAARPSRRYAITSLDALLDALLGYYTVSEQAARCPR
jgi:hypothetical protein